MFTAIKNSSGNVKNYEKLVLYPEHKLKHHSLIVAEELDENVTLVNNVVLFEQQVKKFKSDQHYKNANISQNKSRDQKSPEELKEWIENKKIVNTFLLQENAIFFAILFNNDKDKIIDYYEKALDSWLAATNVPKEQVIAAMIHFDQSTPHMHVSISNFTSKKYKTLDNKEILGVNSKKFNPTTILKTMRDKELRRRYDSLDQDIKQAHKNNDTEKELWNELREEMKFYEPVTKEISKQYDNKIYKRINDQIAIEKVRGYKREIFPNDIQGGEWQTILNKTIFKYREQTILRDKELSKDKRKEHRLYALDFLNKELQDSEANGEILIPSTKEYEMLNKRKYFMRVKVDMALLGVLDPNENNKIMMNRKYNQILTLCYAKSQELKKDKSGGDYTPQNLSKELYEGTYKALKNSSSVINEIELKLLGGYKLEEGKELKEQKSVHKQIKDKIKQHINVATDLTRQFHHWTKDAEFDENTKFHFKDLGIDEENMKKIYYVLWIEQKLSNKINPNIGTHKDIDETVKELESFSPLEIKNLERQNIFIDQNNPKENIKGNVLQLMSIYNAQPKAAAKIAKIEDIDINIIEKLANQNISGGYNFNEKLEKIQKLLPEGVTQYKDIDNVELKRLIKEITITTIQSDKKTEDLFTNLLNGINDRSDEQADEMNSKLKNKVKWTEENQKKIDDIAKTSRQKLFNSFANEMFQQIQNVELKDKETIEFDNKAKRLFDQLEKTGYETDDTYHHGWITFLDKKRIWALSKGLKDAKNKKALDVIKKNKSAYL